ncbi:uncharacterized protein BJ171DRAFT_519703 [Polychytrium aggregatum]|uniref:uncharacterized protein n=1 Tax=Polychytrium aggregatum TaxID=110093 RepID=UPI0022FE808C|nr:uncharacterized protein BJ171DRAFT_519703 [Polychytrium aggregatum]KAI9197479.1 hypothetical protein BJ171DRAFT_519703 [Polychytrium aggregatum]
MSSPNEFTPLPLDKYSLADDLAAPQPPRPSHQGSAQSSVRSPTSFRSTLRSPGQSEPSMPTQPVPLVVQAQGATSSVYESPEIVLQRHTPSSTNNSQVALNNLGASPLRNPFESPSTTLYSYGITGLTASSASASASASPAAPTYPAPFTTITAIMPPSPAEATVASSTLTHVSLSLDQFSADETASTTSSGYNNRLRSDSTFGRPLFANPEAISAIALFDPLTTTPANAITVTDVSPQVIPSAPIPGSGLSAGPPTLDMGALYARHLSQPINTVDGFNTVSIVNPSPITDGASFTIDQATASEASRTDDEGSPKL